MYNKYRICGKANIIKDLSQSVFHKVQEVNPRSTTLRIEWFWNGVWCFSLNMDSWTNNMQNIFKLIYSNEDILLFQIN